MSNATDFELPNSVRYARNAEGCFAYARLSVWWGFFQGAVDEYALAAKWGRSDAREAAQREARVAADERLALFLYGQH